MSGNLAILKTKDGYAPTKKELSKAFKAKGMSVSDFKKLDLNKPVEGYKLAVAGPG